MVFRVYFRGVFRGVSRGNMTFQVSEVFLGVPWGFLDISESFEGCFKEVSEAF